MKGIPLFRLDVARDRNAFGEFGRPSVADDLQVHEDGSDLKDRVVENIAYASQDARSTGLLHELFRQLFKVSLTNDSNYRADIRSSQLPNHLRSP